MPGLHEISPSQLLRRIGLPDAPHIIDVCLPEDFEVRNFTPEFHQAITDAIHHPNNELVQLKRLLCLGRYLAIQPSQFGFALGIRLVVDIH